MSGAVIGPPASSSITVVKWHTRQKHEFLRQYLQVWTQNVGRRGNAVVPTLEIVDLFASRGWCQVDRQPDPKAPIPPWGGTAVLAARALKAYSKPKRLVVNSYDPLSKRAPSPQRVSLEKAIVAELGVTPAFPVTVLEESAVSAARKAAALVDPRFPSIWILDPQTQSALPWATVEAVANHKAEYQDRRTGVKVLRRPELFVTLITEGLQRNVSLSVRTITSALGMDLGTWGPLLEELVDRGLNVREALIFLYHERLELLYGFPISFIQVEGANGNVVYALFFCSSNKAGAYMAKRVLQSSFVSWKAAEWLPKAKLIAKNRRLLRKGGSGVTQQTALDGYTVSQA
jgi:three-Cys-motif partner protein